MKLTMEQVLTIAAGLRALDGLERIVKDGERERVVREPYQLGGGLRLAIARNLNRLDAAQSAYQKARSDLVFAMADANGQLSPARMAEFAFEERKMLGAEEEFDLGTIGTDELKLDLNPIPPTVLSLIGPLLRD